LHVAKFCTGIPNLDTVVAPDGNLSKVWGVPGLMGTDNCADNNCKPFGASSATTYSAVAMLVTVMLAIATLF